MEEANTGEMVCSGNIVEGMGVAEGGALGEAGVMGEQGQGMDAGLMAEEQGIVAGTKLVLVIFIDQGSGGSVWTGRSYR